MKKLLVLGFMVLLASVAFAHDAVLLEWDTPTTNDDGTPITNFVDANGFANYTVKYGSAPGVYDTELKGSVLSTEKLSSLLVPQLVGGRTYCFIIQPINQKGFAAPGWSPESCATLDIQPGSIMILNATKAHSKK